MGVYKHLIEAEQKVNTFYSRYIIDLTKLVVDVDTQVNKYSADFEIFLLRNIKILLGYLKNSLFGIKSTFEDLQKMFMTTKKDITLNNLENCINLIAELGKNLLDSLNFLDKIKVQFNRIVYSSKKYSASISNLFSNKVMDIEKIFSITKKKYDQNDFPKLLEILILDKKILHYSRFNKEMFDLTDILGYSHIHKISLKKYIGNKKIIIEFISKLNFDTVKIEESGVKYIVSDLIRTACNLALKNVTSDTIEKNIISVKNMNSRQLEMRALELLKDCVLGVLDSHSNLLRADVPVIQIELVIDSNYEGLYLLDKSNFNNIFINVILNYELLESLIALKPLSVRGTIAETIIHELSHAYDWILNTDRLNNNSNVSKNYFNNVKTDNRTFLAKDDDNLLSKKISGSDLNSQKATLLSKILLSLREEGLAGFNESKLKTMFVNYNNASLMLFPLELSSEKIFKEFRKMIDKEYSFDKIYDSGYIHVVGINMLILLFIDTYKDNFDYIRYDDFSPAFFKTEDNDYKVASRIFFARKKFGKMSNKHILSYLGTHLFYVIGESGVLKKDVDQFISKVSIMSPEIFLGKYIDACKNYNLSPIITPKDWNFKIPQSDFKYSDKY